jgi:hypothetical protein
MSITLTPRNEAPVCYGFSWEITDEQRLSELVARLMLGHYRHVQKILSGNVQSSSPQVTDEMIDELVGKLAEPESDAHRYQRDGWVFQMISWIAAMLAEPGSIMAIPHSQESQKGFDNLIIKFVVQSDDVSAVVICEDKATENSRKTIREEVWPEIENFERGHRDHELVNEVTAILERSHSVNDIDKCMADIFWKKVRRYRVAITTNHQDNMRHRQKLFKDYDMKARGNTERRRAETIRIDQLRTWMDSFCANIIECLEDLRCMI